MTVSKIRLPDNTEHDIRAKYLIQSTSSDATSAEFSARTVTDDAIANIQKIKGNTIKWNQLVQNGNFTNSNNWTALNATLSISSNVATITKGSQSSGGIIATTIANLSTSHKYYMAADLSCLTTGVSTFLGFHTATYYTVGGNTVVSVSSSTSTRVSQIVSPVNATDRLCVRVGAAVSASGSQGTAKSVVCVDLTAIYGSGNEPTVSEFEAQYPAAYYPYDPGSLTSNSATAIVTTGKNLFDIDTVFANKTGITKTADGWSGYSTAFVSLGDVWKNTTGYTGQFCVYMKATAASASGNFRATITYTDSSTSPGPYLSGTSIDEYVVTTANKVVDTIRFSYGSNRVDVIERFSISIAEESHNGTYEPYQTHQIDLNIPTLTGKLNGAGNSVIVFPNGMQSNGTTRDEMAATSAIKRIADDNSVLPTPQTYVLDNALQLQYPVVAGGTEMVLPTSGTAPMKMDVIYGNAADAAATMSQNFISVDSMKEFLEVLGTQMGGTWSMGYEDGKHTFTFTSN